MDNRVYYGEYSLERWLDLIIKKNIVLPDYQREFVWDNNDSNDLIKALGNKDFVPPVTIGRFRNNDGSEKNIILDGQQRLTSIFLYALGYFPDKKLLKKINEERTADENDDVFNNEDEELLDREWRFDDLLKSDDSNSLYKIANKLENNQAYKKFKSEIECTDNFLKNNYLAFCYIVPENNEESNQRTFYSKVFRAINIKGMRLGKQESRASLYYLDEQMKDFFNPGFAGKILVNGGKLDFVRYISILSQYHKDKTSNYIAKYYYRNLEDYYTEYIFFVIGDIHSDKFVDFNKIFKDRKFQDEQEALVRALTELKIIGKDNLKEFSSIIDLDIYMFGLIYMIYFEKKNIDFDRKNFLIEDLDKKIFDYKANEKHKKNPAALSYLRLRVSSSIDIYSRYVR